MSVLTSRPTVLTRVPISFRFCRNTRLLSQPITAASHGPLLRCFPAPCSRNALLTPEDRQRCVCISQALAAAREAAVAGTTAAAELQRQVADAIAAGGGRVDYVEVGVERHMPCATADADLAACLCALCALACVPGHLPGCPVLLSLDPLHVHVHAAGQSLPPLPPHMCRWWMRARCGQWRM